MWKNDRTRISLCFTHWWNKWFEWTPRANETHYERMWANLQRRGLAGMAWPHRCCLGRKQTHYVRSELMQWGVSSISCELSPKIPEDLSSEFLERASTLGEIPGIQEQIKWFHKEANVRIQNGWHSAKQGAMDSVPHEKGERVCSEIRHLRSRRTKCSLWTVNQAKLW